MYLCVRVHACAPQGALQQTARYGSAFFFFFLLPGPGTQLEQSSQHLPLEGKHNVDHLQAAGDLFQDAVLLPQLVQLPVALRAKVQRVAPSGHFKERWRGKNY